MTLSFIYIDIYIDMLRLCSSHCTTVGKWQMSFWETNTFIFGWDNVSWVVTSAFFRHFGVRSPVIAGHVYCSCQKFAIKVPSHLLFGLPARTPEPFTQSVTLVYRFPLYHHHRSQCVNADKWLTSHQLMKWFSLCSIWSLCQ